MCHDLFAHLQILIFSTRVFQGTNDSSRVEKLLFDLDDNKDGEVDFEEFVNLVAALAVASNGFFVDYVKEEDLKSK